MILLGLTGGIGSGKSTVSAMLAGLGAGLFPNLEVATVMRGGVERFTPQLDAHHRAIRLQGWQQAMRRTLMAG